MNENNFVNNLLSISFIEWETRQVIIFDWYDGPREGMCRLKNPSTEFYFKLLDERATVDELDDRIFDIYELPVGSLDQIITILSNLGTPATPVWVPVWS